MAVLLNNEPTSSPIPFYLVTCKIQTHQTEHIEDERVRLGCLLLGLQNWIRAYYNRLRNCVTERFAVELFLLFCFCIKLPQYSAQFKLMFLFCVDFKGLLNILYLLINLFLDIWCFRVYTTFAIMRNESM